MNALTMSESRRRKRIVILAGFIPGATVSTPSAATRTLGAALRSVANLWRRPAVRIALMTVCAITGFMLNLADRHPAVAFTALTAGLFIALQESFRQPAKKGGRR